MQARCADEGMVVEARQCTGARLVEDADRGLPAHARVVARRRERVRACDHGKLWSSQGPIVRGMPDDRYLGSACRSS